MCEWSVGLFGVGWFAGVKRGLGFGVACGWVWVGSSSRL